jgi:AcrR family transcriptional regulator
MGRRSDHSRAELRALILENGAAHMAEAGLAAFSAREVAKRAGYSIGTIYNVFGSYDRLVLAINTETFRAWTAHLRTALELERQDRIAALVEAYFSFARTHTSQWTAIFDHRLPDDMDIPDDDRTARGELTMIVVAEVARALNRDADAAIGSLARSLIATVHGHCAFALAGAWALMGQTDPEAAALARVGQILDAERG